MKPIIILSIMAMGLVSCATTPNTITNVAPGVDFRQYSTYGFFSPLSTDNQGYESLVSNFLKVAVAQELDRRGLTYSDSPDLMVNFYIETEEKIRTRSVPTAQPYYAYRGPYGYYPYHTYPAHETRIDQYTVGSLNIDVVDAKTNTLVWEGMVSGRVTDRSVRNLEATIDDAVAVIMNRFPVINHRY